MSAARDLTPAAITLRRPRVGFMHPSLAPNMLVIRLSLCTPLTTAPGAQRAST
jgi:hypothetical protein